MAKKKYDEQDGVWRTIGGRKVFIRTGQSLSDAMKESGKFKTKKDTNKEQQLSDNVWNDEKYKDVYSKMSKENQGKINQLEEDMRKNPSSRNVNEKQRQAQEIYEQQLGNIKNKYATNNGSGSDDNTSAYADKALDYWQKQREDTLARGGDTAWEDDSIKRWEKEKENRLYGEKEKAFDNEATKYYSKLTQYQTREDLDMRKRWLQDNIYDENLYKEYEDFYRQGEQYYENKYGVNQKDEDYSKVNEKAIISFGKVDAYGNGRNNNEVTIEMELKDGRFSASGNIWNSKHTDIISGGQNLDEIKEYLKGNKDYERIYNMWQKHHLNDMHAGTEKQEEALNKKFGGVNANKYDEQVAYLKSINLYEDNGYRFGSGWLKRDIPQDDLKEIVGIIRNSNYRKDYDEYMRTHKKSTLSFEEFKKWFK